MNFRELRNRLISSLWDYIGCPVILSNQVQPEAEPPFCIYTVTAPYIPDGGMGDYEIADVAEGVKISRMEMPSATCSKTALWHLLRSRQRARAFGAWSGLAMA